MAEIQVDFDLTTDNSIEADFVLYCASSYNFEDGLVEHNGIVVLDKASNEAIGGVIIGDNIDVTEEGVISVPQATNESFGAIRIATDEEAADKTIVDLCINPKQLIEATEDIARLDSFSAISPVLYNNTTGVFSADFDSEPTENSGKFLTSGVIKTALDGKQDVIADLSTIRAGASAGATAVQPGDNISLLNNDANYQENTIELIEVNGVIQSINEKTVNIPVPTQASDVGALPDTTTINDLTTNVQQNALNSGVTSGDVSLIRTALQPNDNISELNNDAGFISGINSSDVTNALGYTPYDSSNPDGYISGITSSDVTTALGYTPYNSTNPNGYQANILEGVKVNGTSQTITNKTVDITVPTDTSDLTNGAGYITGINSSDVIEALGYTPYDSSNPNGYISGITSSDVTTALGYTPYDSSNPNGFITGIDSTAVTEALGYTPYDSSNPNGYITGIDSTAVTEALGYTPYDSSNPNGYISGITSSDVTTALGYTPYDSSNPDGYQANAIEVIKVNDVAQTITSKAVNIPVPTQPADIGAVPTSRTINNKALTSDITLNSSDVGALSSATTINDLTTTAQQNALNSGATTTNIGQIATNTSDISAINEKIPVQATSSNQLADKAFVNSSIATNTANFIGTFESVSNLEGYSGTVTNNDYAFVINGVVTDNGNDWATFNALDAYDKTLLTNFDYAWVVNGSNFDLYRFDIVAQEWDLRVSDTPKADVTLNTAYNRYKYSDAFNRDVFTVTGTPTITSDGIASGFSSSNKIYASLSLSGSKLVAQAGFYYKVPSANGAIIGFFNVGTSCGYCYVATTGKIEMVVPSGTTGYIPILTTDLTLNEDDFIIATLEYNENNTCSLTVLNTNTGVSITKASTVNWNKTVEEITSVYFGSSGSSIPYEGSIDLKAFSISVDGQEVFSGSGAWDYEYTLNNSSFTASQWAAINSGITSGDVSLIQTALQPNDNISALTNDSGYITGITSSDVTDALGYTPYDSSNPNGYTSNVGTVTSVNNTQPDSNGNVTLVIPSTQVQADWDETDPDSKAYILNKPYIPSGVIVDQTYDSTSTNAQSGVAIAGAGFLTGITSSDVTTALGYTPYSNANPSGYQANVIETIKVNGTAQTVTSKAVDIPVPTDTSDLTNGAGYITGITSSDVTTALGYTPYNSTNPSGYQANVIETIKVNDVAQTVTSKAVNIPVPTDTSDLTNGAGFITGITSSDVTTALGYTPYSSANPDGFISGITSSDVTTALGYTPYDSSNPDGYITGIDSSDVTTALGYTPYDSSNPNGYTSNEGTVTSVNNTQPVNGDVTIAIPSATSDLNNDSGFITSSALADYVTLDTDQNITGTKTYVGQKRIAFKQSGTSDKLGFTLYNSSGTEKGYLEFNPSNTVDSIPLMTLGNYASASAGLTHVGFRKYSSISGASGAYNLLAPLISDAKTPFSLTTTYTNFYLPLGFTNGSTTVTTAKSGVVDLSSLIPPSVTVDQTYSATSTNPQSGTAVAGALSSYVPTTRTINSKALSSNITLTASDVSALPDSTVIPTITDTYSSTSSDGMSGKAVASALASYELLTNVTSKGSATQPVYFDANGVAQNTTYTLAKSVPSDAVFTDTKVTQNVSTTNSTYPILLCPTANASANQGEKTSIFASGVKVNPSTSTITATTFDGNASTATKLGTADKGSATQPIYLSGGTPTACTYTLAKSVPADAVFTDTNTLVTQNVSTTNSTYPILLCPTANATTNQGEKTSIFASGVKVNPSTSTITATTFSGNATSATTATKLGSSNVGSATQPIYLNAGTATACTYTLAKSVPSDAVFTDTTYSVFTGANGTSAGTTGLVKQPAATDNTKFLKGDCTWATPTDTKNTAGSTDTSSKIFLVGATSQTADSQTYSHDTAFVDTSGQLNSANPAASANSTVVATTKWVTDKGYLTSHQTIKQDGITGATVNRYGSCSTGASTAAKTVSITTGTFNLETGAKVTVKFTNANTASTPTLNVNSKGAKNIFHNGAQITTGDNKALLAGTCDFVYDGTQWQLIGNYIDTNTTYANGTGITIGTGNAINHSNSVTAGTAGTSSATSGSTLDVPYVTYDAQGHVTATGTHTHTVTGFATTDTKNTAGSTDTSSKIFLVGATSQAANPQTYSHDTAFVDTNGRLNSAAPASDANDTTVATTKWVKDQSYVTTNTVQTITADKTFNGVVAFENGAATGCVTLGADVAATTVTNDTRKLGRMSFHTYENNVLCAFVSTDSISGNNYVEFGGRTGDTTNTAPDTLSFTIANSHNSVNSKTSALEITKTGGADFKIQPKYNGTNLATETVFTGADGSNAGTIGLVPQPAATDNNKYLKGDGTWGEIDVSSAANKSLSNLETAGENRLHAVKGYFESGTLYTDDTLYASTFTNSSTIFDRTQVSRVSTPVISADGFAYNFANGRYVRSSSSIDCRYPFTIIVNEQKTVTNNLFRGFGLSRTGNVAYPLVFVQPAYSGWFTVGWYINGNLVTRDLAFDEKSYTSVDYILSWDGTYYKFEIRDALTGKTINSDTLNNTSSLYRTEYTGYIIFGWNYNSGQKMELTDLKRARLYSNNELIWSGSAIGMDTVENYLVAGTPTISDGVVSNFSSDNYIDTKQTLTGDTWEIDIPFTTGASFNANDRILGRIYSFGLVLGLTSGGALVLWASSNGTSWDIASSTNSGTKVLSASTSYDIRVKFNGTQYLVDVSSDSGSTWTNYITVSSSSKIFSGAKIVIGTDVDGSATYYLRAGSIDLNGFQILQNSVITYQAYSEILYIKARDGAKIANINDQNKVLQAYEFGKSGYYIINNVNKQVSLPTYELYGLASKGSTSPFVIVDYTT